MPGITAAGLGSGLDINGIINSLMAVERQPLDALNTRETEFKTQLSAYGQLKSALSSFQTAMDGLGSVSKFQVFSATSSDDTVLTTTADSTAAAGSYSVVVTQLAQAHKMASTGFADTTTSIGSTTGTIRIANTTTSFDVAITDDSLSGIRDAINNDSNNIGVTATIINVDKAGGGTENRLVLTSNDTGTENSLTVSDVSGTTATTLAMATVTGHAAQDAIFTVDGFTVTRSSNSVSDALQGVTLNLVQGGGASATITVAHDTDTVKKNVQALVDSYNKLQNTLKSLHEGDLKGDNTLLSIGSQLRTTLNTAPTGLTTSLQYLSEIGITTERDGTMSLDTTKLDSALSNDYSGVAQLLANDNQGYAFRLEAWAKDLVDVSGLLKTREDGINTRINDIEDSKTKWQYRLDSIESRYRTQFTALDTLLSQLQTTSSYLTQQLAHLPG